MSGRQRDRGGGGGGGNVRLSKSLAWLLRHNAESEGFTFLDGGYLPVLEVLKHRRFQGFTVADVKEVVKNCSKQRYALSTGVNGEQLIRANQGHSIKTVEVDLQEITDPEEAPKVVHGTSFKAWNDIQKTGLSRMKRNHIHFAAGELGADGVISGMRSSAQVYIYIDVHSDLKNGIQFFRSANNVILSPGNSDGIIESQYFKTVINVYTNQVLSVD